MTTIITTSIPDNKADLFQSDQPLEMDIIQFCNLLYSLQSTIFTWKFLLSRWYPDQSASKRQFCWLVTPSKKWLCIHSISSSSIFGFLLVISSPCFFSKFLRRRRRQIWLIYPLREWRYREKAGIGVSVCVFSQQMLFRLFSLFFFANGHKNSFYSNWMGGPIRVGGDDKIVEELHLLSDSLKSVCAVYQEWSDQSNL